MRVHPIKLAMAHRYEIIQSLFVALENKVHRVRLWLLSPCFDNRVLLGVDVIMVGTGSC